MENRERSRPVLDPLDRTTEAIFGLLMALTFTGAASVTSVDNPGQILAAALGCNLAWGLADAVIYLLSTVIERGSRRKFLRELSQADAVRADELMRERLGDWGADAPRHEQVSALVAWLLQTGQGRDDVRLGREDYRAALAVFLTVAGSTFPPILPLLLIDDPWIAIRVSNIVSILFLMALGGVLDRLVGWRWRLGLLMPVIGIGLVAIIVALGG